MLLGGECHPHIAQGPRAAIDTSFLCRALSTEHRSNSGHVSVVQGQERSLYRVWL